MDKNVEEMILVEVEKILAREAKRKKSAMNYNRPFDASVRASALVIKRLLQGGSAPHTN